MKLKLTIVILLVLCVAGCGPGNAASHHALDNINILWDGGAIQYAWRFEDDNCVLYVIEDGASEQLAIFQPRYQGFRDYIVDFGMIDDWIILSVGSYQGSGAVFYGDFVRMKKDGSELEHFWLTDDDRFHIIGDWVYYNYWAIQPNKLEGIYRVRVDSSDEEYMGDILRSIIVTADGYMYGTQANNFIRWSPADGEIVTLFFGEILPRFDEYDFIVYTNIKIGEGYILFTVHVWSYRQGDTWRGSSLYTAEYRVDKNGENLLLLNEHLTHH